MARCGGHGGDVLKEKLIYSYLRISAMALPRHEEKTRQGVAIVEHVDERGYVHEQYTNVDECFWGKDPTTCRLRTLFVAERLVK